MWKSKVVRPRCCRLERNLHDTGVSPYEQCCQLRGYLRTCAEFQFFTSGFFVLRGFVLIFGHFRAIFTFFGPFFSNFNNFFLLYGFCVQFWKWESADFSQFELATLHKKNKVGVRFCSAHLWISKIPSVGSKIFKQVFTYETCLLHPDELAKLRSGVGRFFV